MIWVKDWERLRMCPVAHVTRWAFLFVVKKEKQLKKKSSAERGAGGGGERVGQT